MRTAIMIAFLLLSFEMGFAEQCQKQDLFPPPSPPEVSLSRQTKQDSPVSAEEGALPSKIDSSDAMPSPTRTRLTIELIRKIKEISDVKRPGWKARDPQPNMAAPGQYAHRSGFIKGIVIHHTQGDLNNSMGKLADRSKMINKESEKLRNDQHFHMSIQKYGDLAYHFLIGPSGTVYEGRDISINAASGTIYASEEVWRLKENHHTNGSISIPIPKRIGSTEGYLTVCLLGDFRDEEEVSTKEKTGKWAKNTFYAPSKAARQSLVKTVAKLAVLLGWTEEDLEKNIITHREIAQTLCPGNLLYDLIRGAQKYPSGKGMLMNEITRAFKQMKRSTKT